MTQMGIASRLDEEHPPEGKPQPKDERKERYGDAWHNQRNRMQVIMGQDAELQEIVQLVGPDIEWCW